MLTKVCTKCGIEKLLEDFYRSERGKFGRRSHCKFCDNVTAKEWYDNNAERLRKNASDRQRKYRQDFPEKERTYRKDNIDKKRKADRLRSNKYADNSTYAHQLDYVEEVRDNDGLLEVRCAYCNKWFTPSRQAVKHRINTLNGKSAGESRLYCSNGCKQACPTFHRKKYERGQELNTSREVPAYFRKMALEDRNHTCEKCGSAEDGLHVHHINGYSEAPMLSADLCNVLVVCKKCHKEIHKQQGCSYSDYGLCKIK